MVDLVLLSLGGVQRFIAESRSTGDVAGASLVVQRLARKAAQRAAQLLAGSPEPCGLIFPGDVDAAVSNKIVLLAPAGTGATTARAVAEHVAAVWRTMVRRAYLKDPPPTPGMPEVSWVTVTGSAKEQDYSSLWAAAQQELVGRRRARVFPAFCAERKVLCGQSAGLPAGPVPSGARRHERQEQLSAAGWVKRWEQRADGDLFPSTLSIASSSFRSRLFTRAATDEGVRAALRGPLERLDGAVARLDVQVDRAPRPLAISGLDALAGRLGAWVYREVWDSASLAREYRIQPDASTVAAGRDAARAVVSAAKNAGIRAPSPYYAVVVQDLDRLGRALSTMDLRRQRAVSAYLGELAEVQRAVIGAADPEGVLVYAGGDDLLAFCAASAALPLAGALRQQLVEQVAGGPLAGAGLDGGPITASTGVVFAHMSSPLQDTLTAARSAIAQAKSARVAGRFRDALSVVVRRRGGERASTVQPWWPEPGQRADTLLTTLRPGQGAAELSAGLASRLERDEAGLDELAAQPSRWPLLRLELRRLIERQHGDPAAADAVCTLGLRERSPGAGPFRPVPSTLVARFLSQEAT